MMGGVTTGGLGTRSQCIANYCWMRGSRIAKYQPFWTLRIARYHGRNVGLNVDFVETPRLSFGRLIPSLSMEFCLWVLSRHNAKAIASVNFQQRRDCSAQSPACWLRIFGVALYCTLSSERSQAGVQMLAKPHYAALQGTKPPLTKKHGRSERGAATQHSA